MHEVPAGEPAKSIGVLERLWSSLRIGRDGSLVALGGGCTTDVVGFAAATYMRGVEWTAVPTSLVGQVDAALGGKTAIDLPGAKNIVGSFHWPTRVIIDPTLLETLPESERLNGQAEMVKTAFLLGEPLWELSEVEQVRRCAIFKSAVCLADPHDRGVRNQLNLGHTFAHALEAAAGYELSHGRAVALGLLAALRLTGQGRGVGDRESRPRARARSRRSRCRLGRPASGQEGVAGSPATGVARRPRPGALGGRGAGGRRAGSARYAHRVTGRCLCGGVEFEVAPPLREIFICHCSLCRRAGTLAGAYTEVATAALRLDKTETLAWFVDPNERERGFCNRCGSILFWRSSPDTISVSAGALDDPPEGALGVAEHIFVSSAASWETVPNDAPHRDTEPAE